MTTTTAYLSDLSRVRVSFTSLSADADYALVERSTDGITWATVRGGDKVALSAGAGKVDDYEFAAGVLNTYRVTAVDSAPVSSNGAGAFTTGNNATLVPPLPAGVVNGAQMLLFVTHRNTAATITTPTGWTLLAGGAGHMAVFYRVMAGGVTAPSVAFTGGVAGDSCSAQIRAWTNADVPVHAALLTNPSAQDVPYPGATGPGTGVAWVLDTWKQIAPTTAATAPPSFIDQQGGSNSAGANTETHVSWRADATSNIVTVLPGTSLWSGGGAAVSKARLIRMSRRVNVGVETSTITPTLTSAWLKNPSRPSLNAAVTVSDISTIARKARSGTFVVIGRTMPVVVSDVMSSREFSLTLMVPTLDAATELDGRLAAGDPVFIQAPTANAVVPTLYASISGYTVRKSSMRGVRRFFDLDVIEVAAPASTVYGNTYVYDDVVADFATYNDVVASVATYFQLMDLVSNTSVIVP